MSNTAPRNVVRILFASLIGTSIEFFDFYIYATAAVLVFPRLFFPSSDANAATLQSLATFAIAFFARPIGSAVFGHLGDRIGRKATLVAALLTMGLSTVTIGLLPGYASIGVWAPLLLALCRFGQGFGLGGEWGGAVLLATENAPQGQRAWYGMFPQLGAPIGFIASSATFLALSKILGNDAFVAYGWRIPFIASSLLVLLGLYVRLQLQETPVFAQIIAAQQRLRFPLLSVLQQHHRRILLGTLLALPSFALFYLMTVFALSWGTSHLGFGRSDFLRLQMLSVVFFALTIPLSAYGAERFGRRTTMIGISLAIVAYGLVMGYLFAHHAALALILGFALMGMTYGPVGTLLSELFPTHVRYTGASLAFNLAGIFGASLAPYLATWLALHHGLGAVGAYLAVAAILSLLACLGLKETRDQRLTLES